MINLNRRQFLGLSGIALTTPTLIAACSNGEEQKLISGYAYTNDNGDRINQHGVLIFDSDGNVLSDFDVPHEVHLACFTPDQTSVLVCSRKPGAELLKYSFHGQLQASLSPLENQHFEGHGIFSKDGRSLYVTASDYEKKEGRLLILNTEDLSLQYDLSSGGIGPHELVWQSDNIIAIANTGVLTHPDSGREILNKDNIQSNISLFDINSKTINQQWPIPMSGLSARHMDTMTDGSLVIGCQYKKEDKRPACIAFLSLKHGLQFADTNNDKLHWDMKGYSASIKAIPSTTQALITNPRGHLLSHWDQETQTKLLSTNKIRFNKGLTVHPIQAKAWISQGPGTLLELDLVSNKVKEKSIAVKKNIWWGNHMG